MTIELDLTVNGQKRQVGLAETDSLLTVLRDGLGLTGTKRGCNHGVCGACTILIDGAPQRACLKLAATCADSEITTVEGLSTLPNGAALQAAFAEAGAVQCGFCTAGFLLSAQACLAAQPSPSVDEIRHALSGNICRCTGYRKIVDAVRHVAEGSAR
jgi:aerobic carbon-monoxide dehydrogenase small subunit